ncbi:MAG: ion transporter [Myxococcota bacterium]
MAETAPVAPSDRAARDVPVAGPAGPVRSQNSDEASGPRASQLYVEPQLPLWWDLVVIVLTVTSLGALAVEAVFTLPPQLSTLLRWGDHAVCAVFAAEFFYRLWLAPRRRAFLRRNWIDLLGAVPAVEQLRSARIVRLVRLLRVTRVFSVWRRLARRYDVPMPTGALTNLGLTTVVVWLLSAFLFFRFESPSQPELTPPDALWWSMTTLSTVGYGDLYPVTAEGRAVAVLTMVLGIGLLGGVAATTAATFIELRDRGKKGLRSYVLRDHLLVLGWSSKGAQAIQNFRTDPRHHSTDVVIVSEDEEKPVDDPDVRFVRGARASVPVLERASAGEAGAAIVLAADPTDPRSDHETALVVMSLRRLNRDARIAVEMVSAENRDHLEFAGGDALIDTRRTIANLLVRAAQDEGVGEVFDDLVESEGGSEVYRIPVWSEYVGRSFIEYAQRMVEFRCAVLGVVRDHTSIINPEPDLVLVAGDEAFVVATAPPAH